MFNGVEIPVLVNQDALVTSLQNQYMIMLSDRAELGDVNADLLERDLLEREHVKLWNETPLRGLPSELAIHARDLDPNADPVAVEREARSALMEALSHIMETYVLVAAHPVPASMQGKLLDALLAELEEGAEREMAPVPTLTDLCRPRAMVVSAPAVEDEKTLRGNSTHKAERKPKDENKKKRTKKVIREAAGKKKQPEQKRKERTVAQPSGLEATERRRTTRGDASVAARTAAREAADTKKQKADAAAKKEQEKTIAEAMTKLVREAKEKAAAAKTKLESEAKSEAKKKAAAAAATLEKTNAEAKTKLESEAKSEAKKKAAAAAAALEKTNAEA